MTKGSESRALSEENGSVAVRAQLSATERLVEVAQALSTARDLDAILALVRRAGRELTGADGATFVLRDGDMCFYADEDAIGPPPPSGGRGGTVKLLSILVLLSAISGCGGPSGPPYAGSSQVSSAPPSGQELLGTRPPEWQAESWLHSRPLTLASLRGRVVLVRWWTAGCPFCETTAPSLRAIHADYASRGVTVVGMYHHKEEGPLDLRVVEETSGRYGFTFPVAVDPQWKTLDAWWGPRAKARPFTSVTFVLDRDGVVRHVHPGGAYGPTDPAYLGIRRVLDQLVGGGS